MKHRDPIHPPGNGPSWSSERWGCHGRPRRRRPVDLASVLVHETGRFLGLQHSLDDTATMRPFYDMGSTELRDVAPDDVAAICALYPPDPSVDETCNPLGRHGFSPDCLAAQTEADCAFAVGDAPASLGPFSAILCAGIALVRRRRSAAT
ncbi:MAG: matrixin family metalloprotease [Polyangiaceae bacterium]